MLPPPGPRQTNRDVFRFHQGVFCTGSLAFRRPPTDAQGWPPIAISGRHACAWKPYSQLGLQPNGEFRFLVVEIAA